MIIGAATGDMIGAPYEFDRSPKIKEFGPLFIKQTNYTDDTVMTVAVADALLDAGEYTALDTIRQEVIIKMKYYGRKYPYAGYGRRFRQWLLQDVSFPYNSFGNGSAMRVSAAGWLYDSIERTRGVAVATADVTHNHPEGIKGAEAVASAIFLARTGHTKREIRDYVAKTFGYDLTKRLRDIRPGYRHVESCQETVPPAITAFLEGRDFEDSVRNAVSLGGDCDTLTCITASIAEAYFGVPDGIREDAEAKLPEEFIHILGAIPTTRVKPSFARYISDIRTMLFL